MSLEILNASAGSGKTYNLVQTYLKLLFIDDFSIGNFSQIMAMTFTNKAAFEMKERIIIALDQMGNLNNQSESNRKKGKLLIESLNSEIGIGEEMVQKRAKKTLKLMLHQFEDLNVMTIDKFNLRLIRSFSKELNMSNELRVVLNEDEILDTVIESLIDSIDSNSNSILTNLIINYSKEKLEDEEAWDFHNDLRDFSKVITNEKYFKQIENLVTMDYSKDAHASLKSALNILKDKITESADELYDKSLSIDFTNVPGKSTSKNAFEKLKSKDIFKIDGEDGGFFTKSLLEKITKVPAKGESFPIDFASLALNFNEAYKTISKEYHELFAASKNFYRLSLLQFISTELIDVREKEHVLRISEFNKLIANLIKDEYAPFIYEKLGNRYKNFLLDEFQDTSRLQWMNMIPLVHESLSNGNINLIVGDAKQSIYRFKNGLAEQFVALPAIYNPELDESLVIKSNFFESQGFNRILKDNYRSSKKIVGFNNSFFEVLKKSLSEDYQEFYEDVYQNPKGKEGGYIEIVSQEFEKVEENKIIELLFEWVENALKDGYYCGDICILGNTKKECNEWAIQLSTKYKVVSDDSLLVHSDEFVKLTIAFLKWRINPSGELEGKRFSELYFSCFSDNPIFELNRFLKIVNEERKSFYFDVKAFIIEFFGEYNSLFFNFENLFVLVQTFYRNINVSELNNPYIHHLLDMVHFFELTNGPELERFIEYYESKGKNESIQIPENRDALKIMTGHKSKGLEFPIVIIPNIDFSINQGKSKFLLEVNNHFIYTSLSKNSKIGVIRDELIKEENSSFLDKMNLCYVMMTRPIERLYIGNLHQPPSKKNFGSSVHSVLKELTYLNVEQNKYCFGETTVSENNLIDNGLNLNFTPNEVSNQLWFPEISLNTSINSEDDLSDARRYGNQLHYLISKIDDANHIENCIYSELNEGLIEEGFVDRLRSDIYSVFSKISYQNLLSDADQIFNEYGIIVDEFVTIRPDKIIFKTNETIVIDFKTGLHTEKNNKQIKLYKNVLLNMNYPNVRAFLFYINNLQLLEF